MLHKLVCQDKQQSSVTLIQIARAMSAFQVAALLNQLVQERGVIPTVTVNWAYVRMALTVQVRSWNVAAAEKARKYTATNLTTFQNQAPPTFVQVRVPDPDAQGISKQRAMSCVRAMSVFWVLVPMVSKQMESLVTRILIA